MATTPRIFTIPSGFGVDTQGDATIIAAVKKIPGRRYHGTLRIWEVPATIAGAKGLVELARQYRATVPREVEQLAGVRRAVAAPPAPRTTSPAPRPQAAAPGRKDEHPPTDEQARVIELARSGADLKVAAYAGAGKTSTLVLIARALEPRRGAYLAFNKVTAREAQQRFPRTVDCRTIHSFAFHGVDAGRRFKAKLDVRMAPSAIARLLGVPPSGAYTRTQMNLVRAIQATVAAYHQSADRELGPHHVPEKHLAVFTPAADATRTARRILAEARAGFVTYVTEQAEALWRLSIDEGRKDVGMTHDTYLKLWQLSEPRLPVDYVLVDEAQDLNPVTLAILEGQRVQKIWVGDTHQQIYSWRGAVNAMETIAAPEAHITQSFRWGPAVADVANAILELKGPLAHPVRGFQKKATILAAIDSGPVTIISRGNARLFAAALDAVNEGKRLSVVGTLADPIRMMESAWALFNGDLANVRDPELKVFQSWEELSAAAEDDHALGQLVQRVTEYKERIPGLCEQLRAAGEVEEGKADVILTTAHKAKGREWPQVRLAPDYCSHLAYLRKGEELRVEELNILYVAATRATARLELNHAAEELLNPDAVADALAEGAENREDGETA